MTEVQGGLGDLISLFYQEFLKMYGDEELASVATAAVINELLSGGHDQHVKPPGQMNKNESKPEDPLLSS